MENQYVEGFVTILPPYIICGDKNVPSRMIMKDILFVCLSVYPHIGTDFEPFKAIVLFFSGTYFVGVWSKFITIEVGMLLFTAVLIIACK